MSYVAARAAPMHPTITATKIKSLRMASSLVSAACDEADQRQAGQEHRISLRLRQRVAEPYLDDEVVVVVIAGVAQERIAVLPGDEVVGNRIGHPEGHHVVERGQARVRVAARADAGRGVRG